MPADGDGADDDRIQHQAEELMRQHRYPDAVSRYQDLMRTHPGDLWVWLGRVSAMECAGDLEGAEQLLEEAASSHRASAPLHRFRRSFFERREDIARAATSTSELRRELFDEGPADQLADLYFNQGRYLEARGELERLLAKGDQDGDFLAMVQARLGICLRQLGEVEKGRPLLEEALRHDSDQAWIQAELAECDRAMGRGDEARIGFRRALQLNPDDHWTRGHLAQVESEQGNLAEAIELYEAILQAQPKSTWARVELAQVLSGRDGEGDRERARRLCLDALDLDTSCAPAHAHLGAIARRDGNLDDARLHLLRAVGTGGNPSWILHELAEVCRHLGKHEEALTHLERARTADPYDPAGYGYTADVLRHSGKGEQAVAWLEKAVELDEGYTWAWRELAELHALADRPERAEAAYQQACRCDPDSPINDGLKAFLLRLRDQRSEAVAWLERAVARDPGYQWAWRELIDDLLQTDQAQAAAQACERALTLHAEHAPILAAHAEALRRLQRRDQARTQIERALALEPRMAQAWAISAELHAESSQMNEALAASARACECDSAAEYRCLYAQILIAMDRCSEASTALDEVLSRTPCPPIAWELACVAADRAGHSERVAGLLRRAEQAGVQDLRLRCRRARAGSIADLDAMEAALQAGESLPWRDAALVFAHAGRIVSARRCAFRQIEEGDSADVRGWVMLAEVDMTVGDGASARLACEQILRRDAQHVTAHLIMAIAADQASDQRALATHLDMLDRVVSSTDDAHLLRQIAALNEKAGRTEQSLTAWQRVSQVPGADAADRRAERAAAQLRMDAVSIDQALTCLAGLSHDSAARRRLLRDAAITHARQGQPLRGAELVLGAQPLIAERLLAAQLLLAGDRHDEAAQQAALVEDDASEPELRRAAAVLHVRALARLNPAQAVERAQALVAAEPSDEDGVCVLVESLTMNGQAAQAYAAARADGLAHTPSPERAQWLAVLALEVDGPVASAHALARCPRLPDTPLLRLLAAAWGADAGDVAPASVVVLPPLLTMAEHLITGWIRHGRADLAVELLARLPMTTAGFAQRRRLAALASTSHRLCGNRALAAQHALRAWSPWLLLRAAIR